jgi:pyruvate,water dikinase
MTAPSTPAAGDALRPDDDLSDVTHRPGAPDAHWSTDNVGEAAPGVLTPLGWSVWDDIGDAMCRDLSFALGVYSAAERREADRIIRPFHGRIAMRMEWLASVGDRMPGTSGAEAVEGMLGRVPDTMTFAPTARRYPVIAAKLPVAAVRTPREIRRVAPQVEAWWRQAVPALAAADLPTATRTFDAALTRFGETMTLHAVGLFAAVTPLITALQGLVAKTGVGDVGLLSGTGGAEMAIVEDLWRASRGERTVDEVLARHGYHGPLEGEISSLVWREDRSPLERMIAHNAAVGGDGSPVRREAAAKARLPEAQRELTAALPRAQRPAVAALLRHAARTIPLRGVGKASFLQSLDVARASARRIGEHLERAGVLEQREDVFYLTVAEVRGARGGDVRELVARRREQRAAHAAVELPASWRGTPVTSVRTTAESVATEVTGIPAGSGVAEGIVRVVEDPSFADVEPGEILVASTTDPSWASIMFVSAALVVDIGGLLSHAAVVARELGIPCVVNTRTGTRDLRDGDRVRVDGSTGTVTVLERAP